MTESVLPLWWCRLAHYLTWRKGPWTQAGPYETRTVCCRQCAVTWQQRRLREGK